MENYKIVSLIGEGSFGKVYKATYVTNQNVVALKVIAKRGRLANELKNLRRECEIQRHLQHPNIIQMLDSFETPNELVVVTEYAKGDLHTLLARVGSVQEDRAQKFAFDLVSALYYLHSHRILHRDLKPQNILLDAAHKAKLCDFGLARNMTIGTHVLTSIKGTPLYMAPELISEKPYDHHADLWSLGCILFETLAGQPPFCTTSILHLVRLIRHEDVKWPSFLTTSCISFLQGLLEKDPGLRMTWPEILQHSFVAGNIVILDEHIPESPFTNPLTASQSREKDRQADFILHGGISSFKKNCNIPGLTSVSVDMRHLKSDDNAVTSQDSIHAVLQSDIEQLDTDFEEITRPSAAKALNDSNLREMNLSYRNDIAKCLKMGTRYERPDNVLFVSGNSNMIVTHLNDNFTVMPNTASRESTKLEVDASLRKSKNQRLSSTHKSCTKLEKKKLSQNLDNFSLRLGQSLESDKHHVLKSISQMDLKSSASAGTAAAAAGKNCAQRSTEEITAAPTPAPLASAPLPAQTPAADSCDDMQSPNIENDEWIAFIYKTMEEILEGDRETLKQSNLVSIIVAPLRNTKASCRVVENVAQLLSLPLVLEKTLNPDVCNVYVEVKLVPNLVYASKLLCIQKPIESSEKISSSQLASSYRPISSMAQEEIKTLTSLYELICVLVHSNDRFLSQLCDAVAILGADELLITFLTDVTNDPLVVRLACLALALCGCTLRELPENADLIEKIIFDDRICIVSLLGHQNHMVRWRMCIAIRLSGRYSCRTLHNNWTKSIRTALDALVEDSCADIQKEASAVALEFKSHTFYALSTP